MELEIQASLAKFDIDYLLRESVGIAVLSVHEV